MSSHPEKDAAERSESTALSALANHVARCDGVGSDDPDEGWREGCDTCLRRTAPRPEMCSMIEPPPILAFECEFLIEPNTKLGNERA